MFNRWWLILRTALRQPASAMGLSTLLRTEIDTTLIPDDGGRILLEATDELNYAVKEMQRRVTERSGKRSA